MKGQAALLTAVGIGITLLCLMGGSWLGMLGAALYLLTPVAAAYTSMRFGLQAGFVIVAVVSLLLVQLAPPYILIEYIGLFGVGSLLMPWLLRQGQPWDRAIFLSVVGAIIVTLGMVVIVLLADQGRIDQLINQLIQTEVDQAMKIYRESGFSESQLQEMQGFIDGLAGFIRENIYGLLVAGVLAIQMLSLALLQRLKKNDYQISGTPFANWRLPAGLIWVLIVSGFASFTPVELVALTGRNLLVVLLPLYFLQGLAVVSSYLQRKAYPPAVKGLIYAMLFIFNPLQLLITGVGVFDLWIDFRRPRNKEI